MTLVHICCSVDSHYFLTKLREEFRNEEIIGYFYNPNIHPYSEYELRGNEVERSCNILGIKLIMGDYNLSEWFSRVNGLEDEPEKGVRCNICFIERLEHTVEMAKNIGADKFTTTLLMSPKKSIEKLSNIGTRLSNDSISFITRDYKKNGGSNMQIQMVKEDKLYRQDYCGCLFALSKQREQSGKIAVELFSPVNRQIHKGSIEERLMIYNHREELEKDNKKYELVKQNILNYRELNSKVIIDKIPVYSKFLYYSYSKLHYYNTRVEVIIDGVAHLNRAETKIISLKKFNELAGVAYDNVKDLSLDNLDIEKEISVRKSLFGNMYDMSVIIVLDKIPNKDKKISVELTSLFYNDSIVKLSFL